MTLLLLSLIISGCSNNEKEEVKPIEKQETIVKKQEGDNQVEEKQEDPILGKVENNVYINNYLGITYPFPEDWQVSIGEREPDETSISALSAFNYVNGDSLNIVLDKLTDKKRDVYTKHSEKEIVEEALKNKATFINPCKEMGMSDIKVGSSEVSVFNEKHEIICIDGMLGEDEFHIVQLLLTNHDEYTILITISCTNSERAKNTLKKFEYLK